jgi:hypothetical protein
VRGAQVIHELATHCTASCVGYSAAFWDYDLRPAKALYSRFEGHLGRQIPNDASRSAFVVNENAGATVGVYYTKLEAQQRLKDCERDDLMFETARSLVEKAVDAFILVHRIDRRLAHDWIREAAG